MGNLFPVISTEIHIWMHYYLDISSWIAYKKRTESLWIDQQQDPMASLSHTGDFADYWSKAITTGDFDNDGDDDIVFIGYKNDTRY